MTPSRCPLRAAPLALLSVIAACGGDQVERVHDSARPVDPAEMASYPRVADTAARLGFQMGSRETADNAPPDWVFELPQGWTGGPGKGLLRILDFRVPAVPDIQCYMSFTQGAGSTLEANVNRWAGQAQTPPLSSAQIQSLPTRTFLRRQATFVAFDGPVHDGMSGVSIEDATIMGLVLTADDGAMTLKFVGPREEVRRREAEFLALAASIDIAPDPNHGANPAAGGAPPAASGQPMFQNGGRTLAADWPDDWRREQRQMRLLSFRVGDNCECSVSSFQGGVRDNINRWRGQMGLEPLDDAAVAALPRLPMVGAEGTMAVMQGHFRDGMSGTDIEDAVLFGVVCPLQGETLFVKMWGPRAEMEPRQGEFVEFVRSLREEGN